MSYLQRHAPAIGLACLVSLAAVGLSACGSSTSTANTSPASAPKAKAAAKPASTPAAGPSTVDATLTEFKIAASPATAKAGRVVFHVTNHGKVKHQFTVIRTNMPAAKVLSHQNPNDDIPGARGEISSIPPGETKTLVIKKLKPGHYAIVCALPGHYQSGMYTDLTVS